MARHTVWGSFEFDAPDRLGTILLDDVVVSIGLDEAGNSDGAGNFDEGVCLFSSDPLGTIVWDTPVVSVGLSEAVDLDGAGIFDARGFLSPQNCQRVSFLTISGLVGVIGRYGRVDGAGTVGL